MKILPFPYIITSLMLIFTFGCSESTTIQTEPTKEEPISKPTQTEIMQVIQTENTQSPVSFALAEPGPYFAGNQAVTIIDKNRAGREIELLIWYPAIKQTDTDGREIIRNAIPDKNGAPYPMILTEENSSRYVFSSHLATHGFVMVKVASPSNDPGIEGNGFKLVRDFLFSLEQISSKPPDGLENIIDTTRVGVTGYSYGGDISLTISGARVDPEFYLSQCDQITTLVPEAIQWIYRDYYCQDAQNWDGFVDYMGTEITQSDDGLWQPLTDERIHAVMPMAPTVSWYFGEKGLAAVDRPTLLIWGTKDDVYLVEAEYTFEHLKIPDRYLISFIGNTHFFPMTDYGALRLKHFATAFFGYYLQEREEYAEYFSEGFVKQFDDLAWGVFSK